MKKVLFALVAIALFPTTGFAYSFDADLKYGSKGDEVTALQEFLTDQKVYSGPITGSFYSLTLASVKKFQRLQGIKPVSGYVGPVTRGVINQILATQAPDSEEDATAPESPVDLSQHNVVPSAPQTPNAPVIVYPENPQTPEITLDCTPKLQPSVIKTAGNIDTGIDWLFVGTTTVAHGCTIDQNIKIDLQTPTVKYNGALVDWERNEHIKRITDGFVFSQGWGSGSGIYPMGSFIWYVGSSTDSVQIKYTN